MEKKKLFNPIIDREKEILEQFEKIEKLLSQYAANSNFSKIKTLSQERSKLEPLASLIYSKKEYLEQLNDIKNGIDEENNIEMKKILLEEKEKIQDKLQEIQESIQKKMRPQDDNSGEKYFYRDPHWYRRRRSCTLCKRFISYVYSIFRKTKNEIRNYFSI